MTEPHIGVGEWNGGWTHVAGLALPGLFGGSGQSEGRAFAEVALGLARRSCREEGLQLVLRGTAGEDGYTAALLFCRRAERPGEGDGLAGVVRDAAGLLQRWDAAALDRDGLERALRLDPSWAAVRLTKPEEPLRVPQKVLPALVAANANAGAWYPLICRDRFVFDVGVFPLALADAEKKVREVGVASEVVARHVADWERRKLLDENAAAAEAVRAQGVFAGTALTLACAGAEALAAQVRAFRHPARSEVPGWTKSPEGIPAEQLAWAVLDYGEEAEALTAVEPDLRRPLELAGALGFHWDDWRRARRLMDPLDYLLGRVEMFERRLSQKLDEVREALQLAKVNLHSSLGQARRVLEGIVKQHYVAHFPHKRKHPPPLHTMIEEPDGKLPRPVLSLMHTVRVFGNVGAHDTDFQVRVDQFGVVLEALCLLVEWHLTAAP
jgi:hypothetical protein